MPDLWHKLTTWIDHNRYTSLGLLAALIMYLPSCEMFKATGISPISGTSVTAEQHAVEWNNFLANAKTSVADIDNEMAVLQAKRETIIQGVESTEAASDIFMSQLQEKQNAIIKFSESFWTTIKSSYPPLAVADPLVASVFGLGGLGFFVDNRRKDKRIELLKSGNTPVA